MVYVLFWMEDPIPDVMPTYDVAVGGRFKVNTYKVTYMVGACI